MMGCHKNTIMLLLNTHSKYSVNKYIALKLALGTAPGLEGKSIEELITFVVNDSGPPVPGL